MRTLCDVCEAAPARLFCAADEAALCSKCDEKVHGCNKLASRHIRVVLAESRAVPQCDICENAPAFFFCGIDGTSLCLQCDMDVHVGVKKTHQRYLLMGQRVELPMKMLDEEAGTHPLPDDENPHATNPKQQQSYRQNGMLQGRDDNSNASAIAMVVGDLDLPIDLNFRPHRCGESSYGSKSVRDMEVTNGSNFDAVRVAPSKGKEPMDS